MINYISTASKKYLPLLNIRIDKNFQSRCVVRKIMHEMYSCMKKQGNIVKTNLAAINTLKTQR